MPYLLPSSPHRDTTTMLLQLAAPCQTAGLLTCCAAAVQYPRLLVILPLALSQRLRTLLRADVARMGEAMLLSLRCWGISFAAAKTGPTL